MAPWKLWIDGKWLESQQKVDLHSPYNGKLTGGVWQASAEQMESALNAAQHATASMRDLSRSARTKLLRGIAEGLNQRRAEIVRVLVSEAGKPVALAEGEINRAIVTFTIASEETKRLGGDVVPMDIEPSARDFAPSVIYWCPRGPVLGITPFNFPLNLVAHKVAPALASGCPILIKSAPQAPGAAALLAEIFQKAASDASDERETVPVAALQVVSCSNETAALAITDPRIVTVSFTGSTCVGFWIHGQAIGKRTLLELGGNAAMIVHSDADLSRAAERCAWGGFAYAGQSCISVQRVFVHASVAQPFETLLLDAIQKLNCGDPSHSETIVGPMIDSASADRVMSWIDEAVQDGARILCGGRRAGNFISPTVLTGVKPKMKVACEEVFGPVLTLASYENFEEAIMHANDSRFGLQAGVFTQDARLQQLAIDRLEVGGVILNEVPTYRGDAMPYGGVKESGLGREGVRFAMEEFSERKVVVRWVG